VVTTFLLNIFMLLFDNDVLNIKLVVIMYVDTSKSRKENGKIHIRHLLRESHRINGKVVKKTIANISHLSENEIEALRLALRHKEELTELGAASKDIQLQQGTSVGSILVLKEIANRFGITKALGEDRNGRLALWQVIARAMDQGSRLSAVRLGKLHSADQLLETGAFNEDKLYSNLKWLSDNQDEIEDTLFRFRYKNISPSLYLYDVTSSYLEGTLNFFSAFGYNRDGKRGKRQIVIGLLCDQEGWPLSVEVFPGNTQDTATMASQIRKAAERFGAKDVTFVGDRGMIKSKQITDLVEHKFHYITAITKPQIETLLKQEVIQLELFDTKLAEVTDGKIRYILRKNPVRAQEIHGSRDSKYSTVERLVEQQNQYLLEHAKAKSDTAYAKVKALARKLKIDRWIKIEVIDRRLILQIDKEILSEESALDGCYVIKTDLTSVQASKEMVHNRYKDLASVEKAFRYSKTVELDLRPIFVRNEESTRAHAFVVMLSYCLVRFLKECWKSVDTTVQEGLDALNQLCATDVIVRNNYAFTSIPTPRKDIRELLKLCSVLIPKAICLKKSNVSTKVKLNIMRQLSNT
jgi:transposase